MTWLILYSMAAYDPVLLSIFTATKETEQLLLFEPCHEKACFLYPPQTVFVGEYTVFTLSVHPFVCDVLFP